jgi:hypothetical protein
MNPALLFATSPGDMNPVALPFYCLDAGSLLEAITDFTLRL